MPIKAHSDLKVGDRIQEGSGLRKTLYKVIAVERFPDSMCRYGTHVTVDGATLEIPVSWCLTDNVKVIK